MILVDTSVWVDHFKNRNEDLVRLLVSDSALIHPLIIAELACGTPPRLSIVGPIGDSVIGRV
jgi:predicted nucleic acid-binding protein